MLFRLARVRHHRIESMLTPLLARLRERRRHVRKPRRPPNPSEAARTLEYEFNMLGVT